ncbi:GGDEF domain-containing protein [Spirilliplanes yamanashiensis]|nr:GGDEF domain-containing protein [Spirilliplanes yamanashiensis]MDP9817685.1 diguanylate cyclase (GGDEF)-like protein [Spirilliplanes yamanashiensis]
MNVRVVTYGLVSGATLIPLGMLLRTLHGGHRRPWQILFAAMSVLTVANALTPLFGREHQLVAENLMTVGHAILLVAAIKLVLRRGSNDIGGIIDVSVAAMGLGGVLWILLIHPRMEAMAAGNAEQIAVLVSLLVLVGVLGALARVWMVADRRLLAVELLIVALVVSLIGNTILAMSTGSMTTGRPGWIEMLFLLAYLCVGAAPLHHSARELTSPGPDPVDRLTVGRLTFLGVALVANPVAGGARELVGLDADGPLLVLGSLLVAPLVMVRVGRLAWQREQAEQALVHQATHDALTGLPNRAELLTRLTEALDRERASGRPAVVLLFCDLNGFKAVNDRLGHVAGDRLLTEVGARIRTGLRAGDTLARYGGDEFLVLCEESAQQQAVARLSEHIDAALTEPFLLAGEPVRISASVGAMVSSGDADPDELITRADQAMYRAKQRRKAALAGAGVLEGVPERSAA